MRGHGIAGDQRDAVLVVPFARIDDDLVDTLVAGQHAGEHDAVVVDMRLGAEHGDAVTLGGRGFSSSSTVRMPAMPLPTTTRCSTRIDDHVHVVALLRSGRRARPEASRRQRRRTASIAAPGRQRQDRRTREAERIAAGELLGVAEAGGEIEAADAAGHADQAGHQADIASEALRHELEHRAIAHAQRRHADDQTTRRRRRRQYTSADDQQGPAATTT